jgi:hypothetical protein
MRTALEEEECPLDAKLEQVLPGMHRWQAQNHEAVKKLDDKVTAMETAINALTGSFTGTLNSGLSAIQESIVSVQEAMRQHLASSFMAMATQLSGASPPNTFLFVFQNDDFSTLDGPSPVSVSTAPTTITQSPTQPDTNSPMEASPEPPLPVKGRVNKKSDEFRAVVSFGKRFTMKAKHQRLLSLWEEYHGEGEFHDELGGIKGREDQWKSHWRVHLDDQQISRTKRVIGGINNYVERKNLLLGDGIAQLEEVYTANKFSVYKMCKWFKNNKILNKKAARGRIPKNSSSD